MRSPRFSLRGSWLVFALVFAVLLAFDLQARLAVPPMDGPVTDLGGFLSRMERAEIESALKQYRSAGGAQISILTVPSLEGESIETFSIRVAESWRLGSEKKDDGLLIVASRKDRRVRIEVGQGLEGTLPDVWAKRLIEGIVIPSFREGRFPEGFARALMQISRQFDPDNVIQLHRMAGVALTDDQNQESALSRRSQVTLRQRPGTGFLFFIFLFGVVLLRVLFSALERRASGRRGFGQVWTDSWGQPPMGSRNSGWRRGRGHSYWGGFGGGSGWGSGGGWGGGGGGFSGGGSSGGW